MPPGDSRSLGFASNQPCEAETSMEAGDHVEEVRDNIGDILLKLDDLSKV